MFGQTFETTDIFTLAILGILEGLLSADNALVLAIMVRHLPSQEQQKKALALGLAMSFAFRLVAIVLVAWLIGLWWLQVIGAIYLLYLPAKHFKSVSQGHVMSGEGMSFGRTVIALGLADVAFAIDSVLAAVAMVGKEEKTWIVVFGALIGVVLLRYAATVFIKLLERYPLLDHLAYVLIGWVGVKLTMMSLHNFGAWWEPRYPSSPLPFHVPEMTQLVFWSVMAVLVVGGVSLAIGRAKTEEAERDTANQKDEDPKPVER